MALSRLHKTLTIEVRLDNGGVWQCEFTHQLEHIELGSYIEAGRSEHHSGRDIDECVSNGLQRWQSQPWALEMQEGPSN